MATRSPALPYYRIVESTIHGQGMVAARTIPKGRKIIEYLGEKISKEESDRRGLALYEKATTDGSAAVFIFTLDDEWDLDGGVANNLARLINHSCDPNCEAINENNCIWICAKRRIKAGEELSFDYGFEFEHWEDHPCRCGSSNCVGYIVAECYWPKLKRAVARRKKMILRRAV